MNLLTDSVIMIGGCLFLTTVGLILVRKYFHKIDFKRHHEVAGYLLAVIGTMYSVLLGLIVVNVQTKFDQARLMAETEANCCSDIANLCRGFPPDVRKTIRVPIAEYYKVVLNEDWEAVSEGKKSEESIPSYQALWRAIAAYQPEGNREVSCYQTILTTMRELSDARRFRMVARRRGLSPIIWCVLFAGAALTILFTYFFWVDTATMQTVLTLFVALFIALNLLLVRLFENPYRDELMIKYGAFGLKATVFSANRADDNGKADDPNTPHMEQDKLVVPQNYDPVAK
jgi:hypothetical protein